MEHKPRPISQPVLSSSQWMRIGFIGILMAAGTLIVESVAEPVGAAVAATMAFVVFSLFVVINGISCHSETLTAFNRNILNDRHQVMLYGMALLLIFLPTELGFLQRGLGLTSLDGNQWLLCIGLAIVLFIVYEVIKVFLRSRHKSDAAPPAVAVPAQV
jgi:Ca2+-transporting ATPase